MKFYTIFMSTHDFRPSLSVFENFANFKICVLKVFLKFVL